MLTIILVVLLILILFGGYSTWGRGTTYQGGFGLVGLLIVILLILVLLGYINI